MPDAPMKSPAEIIATDLWGAPDPDSQENFIERVEHAIKALADAGYTIIRTEPSRARLISMAVCADHCLIIHGYYDDPKHAAPGITHASRLETAIADAQKMYEEVVGAGCYRPETEERYIAMLKYFGLLNAAPDAGGSNG